jgi:hypothetical protein
MTMTLVSIGSVTVVAVGLAVLQVPTPDVFLRALDYGGIGMVFIVAIMLLLERQRNKKHNGNGKETIAALDRLSETFSQLTETMGRMDRKLGGLDTSIKLLDNDVKHTRLAILAAIEAQAKAD